MSYRHNRETGGTFRVPPNTPYVEEVCASCGKEYLPTLGVGSCPNCGTYPSVRSQAESIVVEAKRNRSARKALFKCQECGRKFYSVKSAEKASFGDEGCPGCGGSDIYAYYGE